MCKTKINSLPNLAKELFTRVQQWMKIENYGIASTKRVMSKNDEKALQILEYTTNFSDGHYEIGLFCKKNAKLGNNSWLAEKQLKQFNKKFSTKPARYTKKV